MAEILRKLTNLSAGIKLEGLCKQYYKNTTFLEMWWGGLGWQSPTELATSPLVAPRGCYPVSPSSTLAFMGHSFKKGTLVCLSHSISSNGSVKGLGGPTWKAHRPDLSHLARRTRESGRQPRNQVKTPVSQEGNPESSQEDPAPLALSDFWLV